ncbi:MAG: Ldh family oxidoreductase [Pseudomonadota bacterium]
MPQTISLTEARSLAASALERCNTSAANAGLVADALVAAEAAGQFGHGLVRVPVYAGQARTGKVDGHAKPTAKLTRPGALMIDAAHGFAYPALELAMANLPGLARAQGIAVAGVSRSHHAGVAGWFTERLAQEGLVAMMFANTPAAMAPTGGTRALFGTNPIAFAAPVEDGDAIVVDLSLSTVARGKILAAAQKGEPIPEGWATDADGNPTTDAEAALKGTMQPMGGTKGAALALMVEVLAAGMTGATLAADAPDFFAPEGAPPGTGQLLLAVDPSALGGTEQIAALAAMFEANGTARLPGARRQALAQKAESEGVEIDADLLSRIEAL